MKKKSETKRRRRALPLVLLGLLLGAGVAYALVHWRRVLMPELQLLPEPDGVSIYEVSGDVTRDWPAGSGTAIGADTAAEAADDMGEEIWGDVPAAFPMANMRNGATGSGGADAADAGDGDTGATEAGDVPGPAQRSRLEDIEGIGPVYAEMLAGRGLMTTDDLLQAAADPSGRKKLAEATGINKKLILRWVNQADLFRIEGVGEQYADLLEAAEVDTVRELAQRRADNLTKKIVEVNESKKLVRRTPTESQVAAWIEHAKSLPRVVTY